MNSPDVRTPRGPAEASTEQTQPTSAIVAPAEESVNQRLIANVICAFELRGFSVHRMEEGSFCVVRWGLSKFCPDLRTLIAFGKQVGATA